MFIYILVAVVLVDMVTLAAGQYDRYSGGRFDIRGSRGLGGSWNTLGLAGSRLSLRNNWGLDLSLGHNGRYRRSAVGYGRYGHYDNELFNGGRWRNHLGVGVGGSWGLNGPRNSWNGY